MAKALCVSVALVTSNGCSTTPSNCAYGDAIARGDLRATKGGYLLAAKVAGHGEIVGWRDTRQLSMDDTVQVRGQSTSGAHKHSDTNLMSRKSVKGFSMTA